MNAAANDEDFESANIKPHLRPAHTAKHGHHLISLQQQSIQLPFFVSTSSIRRQGTKSQTTFNTLTLCSLLRPLKAVWVGGSCRCLCRNCQRMQHLCTMARLTSPLGTCLHKRIARRVWHTKQTLVLVTKRLRSRDQNDS